MNFISTSMTLSKNEEYRSLSDFELEVFNYLQMLRNTGKVHPYETQPYLKERFDISREEANKLINLWASNFREDGQYKLVLVSKLNK